MDRFLKIDERSTNEQGFIYGRGGVDFEKYQSQKRKQQNNITALDTNVCVLKSFNNIATTSSLVI
jgi:hypothetical protein